MNRRVHLIDGPTEPPPQHDYGPKYDVDGRKLPLVVRRPTKVLLDMNEREFAAFKPRLDAWLHEFNPNMVPR